MTKRVLTLVLAVMFVLSAAVLVSCGTTPNTPASTTAPADTTAAKTPTKAETPTPEPATETPTPDKPTEDPTPVQPTEDPSTPDVVTPTPTPDVPTDDPTTPSDGGDIPPMPEEGTAAWAAWLNEYGSESEEYADKEMYSSSFYNTSYTDEEGVTHEPVPWENWGNPKHFHFLITFDTFEFDISFNSSTEISPFTWHIWYKDKDVDEDYKECVTKPWSLYDWGDGTFIFRTPTYAGGMTDVHSDNGEANAYSFVICIYKDETGELECWHTVTVNVTDSYDLYLEEALDNDYVLGWEG